MGMTTKYPKYMIYTLTDGSEHRQRVYSELSMDNQEQWKQHGYYDDHGRVVGSERRGRQASAYRIEDSDGNVEKMWMRAWGPAHA